MIENIRQWLTCIVAVSMLLSVVQGLVPKGSLHRAASFLGGLVLLGLCVAVSLLFSAFFRASHRLCALCSGLCFAVYGLVDYVFYYFAVSHSGGMRYLLVHVGLGSLAAAVLGFCFFGLCRRLDAWGSRPAKI